MPKVTFEGDTNREIVAQVRRWLASIEESVDDELLTPRQAISQGADLTKDALRIVASVAPRSIAQTDLVKALTDMGYKATDATKQDLAKQKETVASAKVEGFMEVCRKQTHKSRVECALAAKDLEAFAKCDEQK